MPDEPIPGETEDLLDDDGLDDVGGELAAEGEDAETAEGYEAEADGGEAPEDEGETQGQVEPAAARKPESRAAKEIRRLRERAQAAERERDEARAAATRQPDLGRAREEQRQREQAEREEEERIALTGDPVTISRFYAQKAQSTLEQRLSGLQFQTNDSQDRIAFENACDRNAAVASVAREAEALVASERAAGRYGLSRLVAAKFIIGDKALSRAGQARTRQTKRADGERQRQTVRTRSARSDVSADRQRGGNEAEARRKRLENELI